MRIPAERVKQIPLRPFQTGSRPSSTLLVLETGIFIALRELLAGYVCYEHICFDIADRKGKENNIT